MSMTLKDKITAWEPQAVWSEAGDGMWTVPVEKFHDLAARLRAEGFDFLRSLTGMDWGEEGFGAVYHLEASATGENVVLRTLTPSREKCGLPSVCDLWKAAELNEREVFDYFGIGDSLEIRPLDEAFDIVSPGGAGEFAYMHGYDEFRRHLTSLFPREAAGIARYCDKIREIGDSIGVEVHRSGRLSSGGVKYLGASAAEFIGECVADPLLRSVLAGTNPLYGGVRESSPLYHHAMINHSNIEGACRFAGGTQHIADALAARIREHGGTILTGCRASALHTEGRRITGVELADGRILRAKSVISAIHPAATFGLIGPTPVLRRAFRDRMAGMPGTYGLFSVYLLLRPQSFPYINRNLYYYAEGGDVWDTLFDTEAMRPKMVLFSAQPPCADPAWSEVVTLMAPIATDIWSAWSGSAPGRRPEAYTALKTAVAEHLTDFVCERLPGLRAAIEQTYAATPLTYRHYTGIPHGAAYGLQKDCRNVMATCIPVRTKFENLLLTGQNLTVHGAIGVTLSAAATCAELLGTEYLAKKIGDA